MSFTGLKCFILKVIKQYIDFYFQVHEGLFRLMMNDKIHRKKLSV